MAVLAGAQSAGEGDGSRAAKLLKLPFMARAAERHRLEAQARPCLVVLFCFRVRLFCLLSGVVLLLFR